MGVTSGVEWCGPAVPAIADLDRGVHALGGDLPAQGVVVQHLPTRLAVISGVQADPGTRWQRPDLPLRLGQGRFQQFGVVAVLGEVCCITAALVAVPALLTWSAVRGARAAREAVSTSGTCSVRTENAGTTMSVSISNASRAATSVSGMSIAEVGRISARVATLFIGWAVPV